MGFLAYSKRFVLLPVLLGVVVVVVVEGSVSWVAHHSRKIQSRVADGSKSFQRCQASSSSCSGIEIPTNCSSRIPSKYLCDGYFDCPDFSDELSCIGCPMNKFFCLVDGKSACLSKSKICDGTYHCDNFLDEIYCKKLSPAQVDLQNTLEFRQNGFLQVRIGDQFMPFCPEVSKRNRNAKFDDLVKIICDGFVGIERGNPDHYALKKYSSEVNCDYVGPFGLKAPDGKDAFVRNETCSSGASLLVSCADPLPVRSLPFRRRRGTGDEVFRKSPRKQFRSLGKSNLTSTRSLKTTKSHPPTTTGNSITDVTTDDGFRIVGGILSSPNAWPFIVSILRNGEHICGGSIINEKWVLTAGHCFIKQDGYLFEVQAGMLRRSSRSPSEQTSLVSYIFRHPEFDPANLSHDLTLLRLQTPLQLTKWVRPVVMATSFVVQVGSFCDVAGWGNAQENGELADALKQVSLPMLANCAEAYPGVDDEQVMCFGYDAGMQDACQGDSGGPLMCMGEDGNVLTGTVSFGRGCARADEPGVYASLSFFHDWITKTIEANEKPANLPSSGPVTTCPGILCSLKSGACLQPQFICDGTVDCLFGEDESCCGSPTDDTVVLEAPVTKPTVTKPTVTTESHHDSNHKKKKTTTLAPTTHIIQESLSETNAALNLCPEYTCETSGECVAWNLTCEGHLDCQDGSDEHGCQGVDRLFRYRPDLECDGTTDVWDCTDEDCDLCESDSFLCSLSKKCIPLTKVCDTVADCQYGEDERDCVALSTSGLITYATPSEQKIITQGTLTLRTGNLWNPVCVADSGVIDDSVATTVCSYLGFSRSKKITYFTSENTLQTTNILCKGRAKRSAGGASHRKTAPRPVPQKWPSLSDSDTDFELGATRTEWPENSLQMDDTNWQISGGNSTLGLDFLRILRRLTSQGQGRRWKRETCKQVFVECADQAIGKAHPFYFSNAPNINLKGGTPWAGSIYVDGNYQCGATLIKSDWAVTSQACMASVDWEDSTVTLVFGSWRLVGSPTRLWGPHEVSRIVDFWSAIDDSDIFMVHANQDFPYTQFINYLSMPTETPVLDSSTQCATAGVYNDRLTYAVDLSPQDLRTSIVLNVKPISGSELPCMNSWSGLIFCRNNQTTNPVWGAVGVWTYEEDVSSGGSKKHCNRKVKHVRLTTDLLNKITMAMSSYKPANLPTCNGLQCQMGKCISKDQLCDFVRDCPDQADEPATCSLKAMQCTEGDSDDSSCRCPDMMAPCVNGQCIPMSKFCDSNQDCRDGTDESTNWGCDCMKLLLNTNASRICNGIIDCSGGMDEADCGCDADSEFRCFSSTQKICTPKSALCNGVQDCDAGEDESYCAALAPTIFAEENVQNVPIQSMTGYLLLRRRGSWYTISSQTWNSLASDLVCHNLGYWKAVKTQNRKLDLSVIGKMAEFDAGKGSGHQSLSPSQLRAANGGAAGSTVVYITCQNKT